VREGRFFACALDFDELATAGHYNVGIYFGVAVFDIVEVEYRCTFYNADADGGDGVAKGVFGDSFRVDEFLHGESGGDVSTGD